MDADAGERIEEDRWVTGLNHAIADGATVVFVGLEPLLRALPEARDAIRAEIEAHGPFARDVRFGIAHVRLGELGDGEVVDGAWTVHVHRHPRFGAVYVLVASDEVRYAHARAQVYQLWERKWRAQIPLN